MNQIIKAGRCLLCLLPALVLFAITNASGFSMMLLFKHFKGDHWEQYYMDNYLLILLITQLVYLAVLGGWYWTAQKKERHPVSPKRILNLKTIGIILMTAVGMYSLICVFLWGVQVLLPGLTNDYNEMIETTGISSLSILSTICTLILAPLAEEVVFRGLTMKMAERAGIKFAAANLIQALLFGITHGNWIQGTYAFGLGLILGYLYKRYHTLCAPVLLHIVFNFLGSYVASWLVNYMPVTLFANAILLLSGCLLVKCSIHLVDTDSKQL